MQTSVRQGDAIEWLHCCDSNSVDLVITDPPYESLEKHRLTTNKKTGVTKNRGRIPRLVDWFPVFPNARFPELFSELYRVMRKNTHLYMFCDAETMFFIKPMAEAAGFKFWKPLVWDKQCIGMGYHYRSRYEFVLFFEKGKRKLADLGIPDVLESKRIRGSKRNPAYPTEKPVEIAKTLIEQSTKPDELVIDPFCGSGSVGVAALMSNRQFIGVDVSERAVELARDRLGIVT